MEMLELHSWSSFHLTFLLLHVSLYLWRHLFLLSELTEQMHTCGCFGDFQMPLSLPGRNPLAAIHVSLGSIPVLPVLQTLDYCHLGCFPVLPCHRVGSSWAAPGSLLWIHLPRILLLWVPAAVWQLHRAAVQCAWALPQGVAGKALGSCGTAQLNFLP